MTIAIDQVLTSQAQKEVVVNGLFNAARPSLAFGIKQSATVGLSLGIYGGVMLVAAARTEIADQTITLTASATNWLYLTSAGVLTKVTAAPTGWPDISSPAGAIALYKLTVGANTVTSIDERWRLFGGVAGPTGVAGFTVLNGSGLPSGGTGVNGDFYIDTTAHAIYGPKAAGAWGSATNLVGTNGTNGVDWAVSVNAQTGTTYTVVAGDNGKVITMNNASASTLTVPSGLGANFAIEVIQIGAGQVTIAGSGITLNSWNSLVKVAGQHGAVTLIAYAANVFNLSGNLVS